MIIKYCCRDCERRDSCINEGDLCGLDPAVGIDACRVSDGACAELMPDVVRAVVEAHIRCWSPEAEGKNDG